MDYQLTELAIRVGKNPLSIPEPVALWLESFGTITSSTGEKLRLAVPAIPDANEYGPDR